MVNKVEQLSFEARLQEKVREIFYSDLVLKDTANNFEVSFVNNTANFLFRYKKQQEAVFENFQSLLQSTVNADKRNKSALRCVDDDCDKRNYKYQIRIDESVLPILAGKNLEFSKRLATSSSQRPNESSKKDSKNSKRRDYVTVPGNVQKFSKNLGQSNGSRKNNQNSLFQQKVLRPEKRKKQQTPSENEKGGFVGKKLFSQELDCLKKIKADVNDKKWLTRCRSIKRLFSKPLPSHCKELKKYLNPCDLDGISEKSVNDLFKLIHQIVNKAVQYKSWSRKKATHDDYCQFKKDLDLVQGVNSNSSSLTNS